MTAVVVTEQLPPKITSAVGWKQFINSNQKAIAAALPRIGITPEAVARTAFSQMYKNPVLQSCEPVSVMRAIVEAANLGLTFSLGRAYLVPFRNNKTNRMEAQLIPGYQGLVDLVRRASEVQGVLANAVYEGDEFVYNFGLERDVFHHKSLTEPDDEKLTHAYCIIRFHAPRPELPSGYQMVVLTRKQIEAVRARSKAKDSGPWVTDFAAMAVKSAVRRCTKLCPASAELVRALELDDAADLGQPQNLDGGEIVLEQTAAAPEAEQPATQAAKVADKIRKTKRSAESHPSSESQQPDRPEAGVQPAADTSGQQTPTEGASGTAAPASFDPKRVAAILQQQLVDLAGNVAQAEMMLSEATAGKIQKFTSLVEMLGAKPEWAEMIDLYVERKKEP